MEAATGSRVIESRAIDPRCPTGRYSCVAKKRTAGPDSVGSASLYAGENQVTFVVSGKRFSKDGTLGMLAS
jgi:hypothetical protein